MSITLKEHAENTLRLRKGEGLLVWLLHKIMKINCFSSNVRQCTTSLIVLCKYNFFFNNF